MMSDALSHVFPPDATPQSCAAAAAAACACAWAAVFVARAASARGTAARMRAQAAAKRAARDARRAEMLAATRLPRFEELEDGLRIVSLSASEMVRAQVRGELSSVQIVTACCARAVQAGLELSCNAEEMFAEALEEAARCDAERLSGKGLRGALHGVPLSIKDQMDLAGYDSTCGLAARCFQPAETTAVTVQVLIDEGAIPFVRSNVPQSLMVPETMCEMWGTALNPFSAARSPGGSSGGESALVGCRASPLGIGSDIGGSVRLPALHCGVVGVKPTPQRFSLKGMSVPLAGNRMDGQLAVVPTVGALARSVEDVEVAMRAWCDGMTARDGGVPPMPWRAEEADAAVRRTFGVLRYDGFYPACAAYERALDETVAGLRRDGHTVVELTYDMSFNARLFMAILGAEGGLRGMIEGLEGEALHTQYQLFYTLARMPAVLKRAVQGLCRLTGAQRMATMLEGGFERSVFDYKQLIAERDRERDAFIAHLRERGVDAVLCPGPGQPAFKHDISRDLSFCCVYTFLWNCLGFPAGAVPVTYVRAEEEVYEPAVRFGDALEAVSRVNLEGAEGLPIGVQVATLPYRDEACVGAMHAVEKAVGGSWKPPQLAKDTAFVKQG
eukprot:Rhum_TRINITY_DN9156_c0_g1::Rhum_TRINITY_DN9156_c0_g1_i1::g.31538::m.31538/K15528/FAAH; fatty acid amide hydrolase